MILHNDISDNSILPTFSKQLVFVPHLLNHKTAPMHKSVQVWKDLTGLCLLLTSWKKQMNSREKHKREHVLNSALSVDFLSPLLCHAGTDAGSGYRCQKCSSICMMTATPETTCAAASHSVA